MRIGMIAGEPSGDALGAKLVAAIRERYPDAIIEGIGGPLMISAGFHSLFDMERLSIMGLVEILAHLPDLIKLRRDIYQHFSRNPPDVFIGIDAPEFNVGLELKLRELSIPTVHYVSPSVWAWRQYRIHKIAKAVNLMLTLLPFEAAFYENHHVPVQFVGHPFAMQIPLTVDSHALKRQLALDEQYTYIALLPGSRQQEIHYLAKPFLQAAKLLYAGNKQLRFLTSQINEKSYRRFYDLYQEIAPEIPLQFFTQRSHEVMAAADVVVVASGTATLETMLYKKPMVITYRLSGMTYQLAKWLVKIPYMGLPNLLAGRLLVPELKQYDVTPEKIAYHVNDYLHHPEKIAALQAEMTTLHERLRGMPASEMVDVIMNVVVRAQECRSLSEA